jgi:hypothetical protein
MYKMDRFDFTDGDFLCNLGGEMMMDSEGHMMQDKGGGMAMNRGYLKMTFGPVDQKSFF